MLLITCPITEIPAAYRFAMKNNEKRGTILIYREGKQGKKKGERREGRGRKKGRKGGGREKRRRRKR